VLGARVAVPVVVTGALPDVVDPVDVLDVLDGARGRNPLRMPPTAEPPLGQRSCQRRQTIAASVAFRYLLDCDSLRTSTRAEFCTDANAVPGGRRQY
jgi:hypothetical protein